MNITQITKSLHVDDELEMQNLKGRLEKYMKGTTKGFKQPLLQEQQEVLKEYYKFLLTEMPKVKSILTYIDHMRILSLFGNYVKKPYMEITKDELKDYFFYLHQTGKQESTIQEYQIKIKSFYRFLYGTDECPDVVKWIKVPSKEMKKKTAEELLSREDIKNMLEVCQCSRDRAIIKVLFESAARRAELLSCNIRHVIIDNYGIKLKLPKSKTKERAVRLIDSVPELQAWINEHPRKKDLNAPLFCGSKKRFGQRLTASGLQNIIRKTAKRAEIPKKVSCHLFRHSRLNELGKMGFNERDLQIIAGWSENTKMPKHYLHYDEDAVDKKLLEKEGMLTDEDKEEQIAHKESLEPKKCQRCNHINESVNHYCSKCGMALNLKQFMDDQEIIKKETDNRLKIYAEIMSNPEKRQKYEEFKQMFQDIK